MNKILKTDKAMIMYLKIVTWSDLLIPVSLFMYH